MGWPQVTSDHHDAVLRVLDSGIFVDGSESRALEREAAEVLGYRHAVYVSNGTTGLMAVLAAWGVSPDDHIRRDIGIPSLTFSGTAYGANTLGADIGFTDVGDQYVVERWDEADPPDICIPVHLHGRACTAPVPFGALVIDDSCQAPRARTPGAHAAVVSLNHSKTLWGGEGGLVLTDDHALAQDLTQRRVFGETMAANPRQYVSQHKVAGNWRGTELTAALARASLMHLDRWEARSLRSAAILDGAVEESPWLTGPDLSGYCGVHKYRVMVDPDVGRDHVIKLLQHVGVPVCTWQTRPLGRMPAFTHHGGNWANASRIIRNSVIIGDEQHPLCTVSDQVARRWAEAIAEVCR